MRLAAILAPSANIRPKFIDRHRGDHHNAGVKVRRVLKRGTSVVSKSMCRNTSPGRCACAQSKRGVIRARTARLATHRLTVSVSAGTHLCAGCQPAQERLTIMATVVEALVPPSEVLAPKPVITESPSVEAEGDASDVFERVECWLKYLGVIRTNWRDEDFTWEEFSDGVEINVTLRNAIDAPATIEELQQQVIDLLRSDADTLEESLGVRKVEVNAFAVVDSATDRILGTWLDEADAQANLDGVRQHYGATFGRLCPMKAAIILGSGKGGGA